jgi:hypothetical protein
MKQCYFMIGDKKYYIIIYRYYDLDTDIQNNMNDKFPYDYYDAMGYRLPIYEKFADTPKSMLIITLNKKEYRLYECKE